ncbi:unnamed protein product, partial [Prorocentrum cordatum]
MATAAASPRADANPEKTPEPRPGGSEAMAQVAGPTKSGQRQAAIDDVARGLGLPVGSGAVAGEEDPSPSKLSSASAGVRQGLGLAPCGSLPSLGPRPGTSPMSAKEAGSPANFRLGISLAGLAPAPAPAGSGRRKSQVTASSLGLGGVADASGRQRRKSLVAPSSGSLVGVPDMPLSARGAGSAGSAAVQPEDGGRTPEGPSPGAGTPSKSVVAVAGHVATAGLKGPKAAPPRRNSVAPSANATALLVPGSLGLPNMERNMERRKSLGGRRPSKAGLLPMQA